jgi:hypothetical protein
LAEQRYRLVFRGEILADQHPAVVRKRLGEALRVGDEALERLFSGRNVVVRKEANAEDAARLQAAFKKAGCRLRVVPIEDAAPASAPSTPVDDAGLTLLPPGSDLLAPHERRPHQTVDIDTAHLSLASGDTPVATRTDPPDIEAGDFTLAEAGEPLLPERPAELPAALLAEVLFELAEAGSLIGGGESKPVPAPPDTSHLKLEDDER